ncbi:phosphatidylinositol 4-phosphate 5-kinase-like protein 1 isoform X2 [Protopterus annectens]|nr:phosphatidylinositol 4-phosphate 5-kinase-like protein 1 isoform X2 [Protopterus annectens]
MSFRSRTVKNTFLWRVREQWKLLGLFEINKDHEFYDLTCMLKKGLSTAVQHSVDNSETLGEPTEKDYADVLKQSHEGFELSTYAGPVFSHFRQTVGITDKEYQSSLSSEGFYLQFISNSKSKADFFLTHDKRIFLKTQTKREIRFLLTNLKTYIHHLEKYPHSLLVKFLGVHRIRTPELGKKYFIIMQSVFYPDERILARYDIKGCQVSRWTDPAPEGSQIIVVLKDLNFEQKHINLDQQRSWLVRQVEIDTQFLQTLNVMDYSFLLAYQPLHADERRQSWSFASIILRTKKSVNSGGSPTVSSHTFIPGIVEEEETTDLVTEDLSNAAAIHWEEVHTGTSHLKKKQNSEISTDLQLHDLTSQHRRLLPGYKNPLHVIDGPDLRYFVGIIDIFTVYSFRKKLEYLWKSIRYRGQKFSTVSPAIYANRICQWIESHTV